MIHIEIPEDVKYILKQLREAGYEAYAVGGCVRDSLLKKIPKDFDITTSALPEEVKNIFPKTVDTGIKHGTVTVMMHGTGYEVTTYRVDGEYLDGRHPESVEFTASLDEDLKRRDFTINAFAYSEETGVKDLFGGLSDLENKVIKCVGNPEERFTEDALRILRAVRFSAQLDFSIDRGTFEAAKKLSFLIEKVSCERIKAELDKILLSDNPGFIALLDETGIDRAFFRELSVLKKEKNGKSGFDLLKAALEKAPKELTIRWALVFFFIETMTKQAVNEKVTYLKILQDLKFDNKTRDRVRLFINNSERPLPDFEEGSARSACRRLICTLGSTEIFDFLSFRRAVDEAAYGNQYDYVYLKNEISDIMEKRECTSLKELAVNGNDIKESGKAAGSQIGIVLNELLDIVLSDPEKNNRETLMKIAFDL